MALGKLPYKQLRILIKDHLVLREDPETAKLIRELKQARRRTKLASYRLAVLSYQRTKGVSPGFGYVKYVSSCE